MSLNYLISVCVPQDNLNDLELGDILDDTYGAHKHKSFELEHWMPGIEVIFTRNYDADANALNKLKNSTGATMQRCARELLAQELEVFNVKELSEVIQQLRTTSCKVTGFLGHVSAMGTDDLYYAVTSLNLVNANGFGQGENDIGVFVRELVLELGISVIKERNKWKAFFGSYGHDTEYLERDTYDEAVLTLVLDRHLDPAKYQTE